MLDAILDLVLDHLDVDDLVNTVCVSRDFRRVTTPKLTRRVQRFVDELRVVLAKAVLGGAVETLHSARLPGAAWLVFDGLPRRRVVLMPTTDERQLRNAVRGLSSFQPYLSALVVLGPPRIVFEFLGLRVPFQPGFRAIGGGRLPLGVKLFRHISVALTL